ncbi:CDP-glucose 4,6-dehydratase [Erysipelotrichia bacterium]
MESLVNSSFNGIFRNRRVLVTGHSGFKGSWLTLWLTSLGAKVSGIALRPETSPNHWDLLNLPCDSHWLDIRNGEALDKAVQEISPELIIHMAAQPLVRRSYKDPLATWQTNVNGTVNLLETARKLPKLRAILCITTDKCYENREWYWGYREIDPLGGHDPYSASKAAAEIAVASYRKSFFNTPEKALIASARAGNVIGGGDWSEDRILPDLVRSIASGQSLEIRSPNATRPWQHVIDCLNGYLMLCQKLLECRHEFAEAWNFGPDDSNNRTVAEILALMQTSWPELRWHTTTAQQPHEAALLHLDSSKARIKLGWRQIWNLEKTVLQTASWYNDFLMQGRALSSKQLGEFMADLAAFGN